MLLFHSTNGQSPAVNLREALLHGQAPDRGLYLPEKFPTLAPDEIAAFANLPYHEIAFRVLSKFTDGIIPDDDLGRDVPRRLQLSTSRWKKSMTAFSSCGWIRGRRRRSRILPRK